MYTIKGRFKSPHCQEPITIRSPSNGLLSLFNASTRDTKKKTLIALYQVAGCKWAKKAFFSLGTWFLSSFRKWSQKNILPQDLVCAIFSVTKHGVRSEYGIDRDCSEETYNADGRTTDECKCESVSKDYSAQTFRSARLRYDKLGWHLEKMEARIRV